MEIKLGILYFSFSLGCVFSGAVLTLVPPVKYISPVAADKEDVYLRFLCTTISSGAGASD